MNLSGVWQALHVREIPLLLAVAQWRRRWLTPLFVVLTWSGTTVFWLPASVMVLWFLLFHPQTLPGVEQLAAGFAAAFGALVSGQMLKRVFQRPRAFHLEPNLLPLGPLPKDSAMPSTHTSTAVALAAALVFAGHPWWPLACIWASLVVTSRLYLGVHYPSDLLGGASLGLLWGGAALLGPVLSF